MSALNTEFSGGNSLSGYRNKTIYDSSTNAATTIAASGAISFSQFRGKRALAPPVVTAYMPTISAGVLTYTWSGTNSPTSYSVNLYRSGSATALATQTSGTSATYSSLTAGYVYYITVAATNAAGTSTLVTSGTVTYNPPVVTANAPTISNGTMTYSWSGTNSPSSYTVILYSKMSNTFPGSETVRVTLTNTQLTSSTYSPIVKFGTDYRGNSGPYYYITVTATNASGTSDLSTSETVTYNPPVATAATPTVSSPAYTPLVNGATYPATGTPITLINTSTVGWYNLMINYTINGVITYFTTGMSSGQYLNIASGAMYTGFSIPANITSFGIQATDTDFKQSLQLFTNSSGILAITNPNPSLAVNSIISVKKGGPTLTYTWGTSSGTATSYTVNLYAVGNATALLTLTNTTATSAAYLPVGGTTYYTTVDATNTQGSSAMVTSGTVTYRPPTTPTGVAIKIAHGNGSGGIRVSWTEVLGATSYSLTNGTTTVTPTGTSGFLPLKADGSKQFITVTAINAQGTSAASASTGISYFPGKSSYYTWTGVGSCKVTLAGAGGGNGGQGGLVSGIFDSSSSTWYIIAGTRGTFSAGGYGGGGAPYTGSYAGYGGGGGGGGCSCISTSSTAPLTTMSVTAGGGGGVGFGLYGTYIMPWASGFNSSTTAGVGAAGVNGNSGGGGGGAYGGLNSGGGTNYDANLTSSSINVAGGGKSNQDGYVIITWGSVTPTLINPMSVSPYINIWFDAADSTTVTGTTAVSAWASKGTFIIDAAVPRTGTTSYITANQNGLNIIRCGAGVDMTFAFGSPTQSRAWFIVAKNTTQLVSSGLGQYWTLVNQTQSDYQDSPSGPNYAGGAYVMGEGPSTRGTNILATTNNNPYNAWKCYTWVNSATSAANNYIGINTTSYTLTESRPAILDGNTTAGYGYRTDKVTYSINTQIYGTGADIGEIMMYNDEITSTDRDTVISYLMTKWGIT